MLIRRLTPLLVVFVLAGCVDAQRQDDGTTFHLGAPHISFPHFFRGGGEDLKGQLEKDAEPGRPIQLWGDTTLGPDCVPTSETKLEVTTPPTHGAVVVRPGRMYAIYPQGHPREICSGRLVTGMLAVYTADKAYSGPDRAVLRGVTADGQIGVVTIDITVQSRRPLPIRPAPTVRPRPTNPDAPAPTVLQSPYPGG